MHAKDLLINDRTHWQTVENVRKDFPELDGVSSFTFVIKTVDAVNLGTLVIASQQEKIFWELNLVAEQQGNCFN